MTDVEDIQLEDDAQSGIVRVKHNRENPYTMIHQDVLENAALSWEARGMLAYLVGKPDDWQVRFTDLVRKSPAGPAKTRRIIKELEAVGHIVQTQTRNAHGGFVWTTTVYEVPLIGPDAPRSRTIHKAKPKPIIQKPNNGKAPHILSIDLTKDQTEPQKALLAPSGAQELQAQPEADAAPLILTAGVLSEKDETEPEQTTLRIANTRQVKVTSPTLHKIKAVKVPDDGKKGNGSGALAPTHGAMFTALAEVCHADKKIMGGRLNRAARALLCAETPSTPEEIRGYFGAGSIYWREHWKGKKNEFPDPEDVANWMRQAREAVAAQCAVAEVGPKSYGAGRW